MKIDKKSKFLFVLKKITNYDYILFQILQKYSDINIRFIIIESKYINQNLDKNKDDFLCQYFFCSLLSEYSTTILISNDLYRDKECYVKEFLKLTKDEIVIRAVELKKNKIEDSLIKLEIKAPICALLLKQIYTRCTIPKCKLYKLLN